MTIQRVQRIIQMHYGQQYMVELFGSTRYGISSASSDLDLVIIVSSTTICKSAILTQLTPCEDLERMSGFSPDVILDKLPGKPGVILLLDVILTNPIAAVYNIRSEPKISPRPCTHIC